MRRIEFGTKGTVAENVQGGWKLELETVLTKAHGIENGKKVFQFPAQRTITCSKLVVGTGLTSVPQLINIKGSENFEARVMNFGDYPAKPQQYTSAIPSRMLVIGGGKAAYDIVYLMATHGIKSPGSPALRATVQYTWHRHTSTSTP